MIKKTLTIAAMGTACFLISSSPAIASPLNASKSCSAEHVSNEALVELGSDLTIEGEGAVALKPKGNGSGTLGDCIEAKTEACKDDPDIVNKKEVCEGSFMQMLFRILCESTGGMTEGPLGSSF